MRAEVYIILPGFTGIFSPKWKNLVTTDSSKTIKFLYKNSSISRYETLSFEERLIDKFNLNMSTPWAWFGILGEGFKVSSPQWLKLNIQTSNGDIIQDQTIIKKIAEDFTQEFPYAKNSIITPSGGWYLSINEYRQIRTESIWSLESGLIKTDFGLQGSDMLFWQEYFYQASKWLLDHSLNQERLNKKLAPMNHIYPWGFSNNIPRITPPNFTVLFSDNPIYRGMANYLSVASFPRSFGTADLSQLTINHRKICVIDDSLAIAKCSQDFKAWNTQRLKVEQEILDPYIEAVRQGILDDLKLDDGLGTVLHYKRGFRLMWSRTTYSPVFY